MQKYDEAYIVNAFTHMHKRIREFAAAHAPPQARQPLGDTWAVRILAEEVAYSLRSAPLLALAAPVALDALACAAKGEKNDFLEQLCAHALPSSAAQSIARITAKAVPLDTLAQSKGTQAQFKAALGVVKQCMYPPGYVPTLRAVCTAVARADSPPLLRDFACALRGCPRSEAQEALLDMEKDIGMPVLYIAVRERELQLTGALACAATPQQASWRDPDWGESALMLAAKLNAPLQALEQLMRCTGQRDDAWHNAAGETFLHYVCRYTTAQTLTGIYRLEDVSMPVYLDTEGGPAGAPAWAYSLLHERQRDCREILAASTRMLNLEPGNVADQLGNLLSWVMAMYDSGAAMNDHETRTAEALAANVAYVLAAEQFLPQTLPSNDAVAVLLYELRQAVSVMMPPAAEATTAAAAQEARRVRAVELFRFYVRMAGEIADRACMELVRNELPEPRGTPLFFLPAGLLASNR